MSFKNAFNNYSYGQDFKVHNKMDGMAAYFEKLKARLHVEYEDTLFPPTFEDIRTACQNQRCILCNCKLYLMREKPLYYCKSVKHKKRFVISKDKLERIAAME